MISHTLPLEDVNRGFAVMLSGESGADSDQVLATHDMGDSMAETDVIPMNSLSLSAAQRVADAALAARTSQGRDRLHRGVQPSG